MWMLKLEIFCHMNVECMEVAATVRMIGFIEMTWKQTCWCLNELNGNYSKPLLWMLLTCFAWLYLKCLVVEFIVTWYVKFIMVHCELILFECHDNVLIYGYDLVFFRFMDMKKWKSRHDLHSNKVMKVWVIVHGTKCIRTCHVFLLL